MMHGFRQVSGIGMMLVLACCAVTRADEVLLIDGSRVIGKVGKVADGKLTITTDFAGELKIDMMKVRGVTTDEPVSVETVAGERAKGPLKYNEQAGQVVASEALGAQPMLPEQMKAVWLKETESPEAIALSKAKPKWGARIEGAIDGQTGNNESTAAHGRAEVNRTTSSDRFKAFLQGRYAKRNGERTTNEIMGGMGIETDLNDRLFAFGKITLEYDEFEDLDLRSIATGGLGYFWIREDDQELKTRAGVGYQHESFSDNTTDDQFVIELGVDYKKKLAPWLLFTHSTTYYPTIDGLDDFRLISETAGEIPLGSDELWRIRVGMSNNFDNTPRPGIEKLDTYYFLSLVMDFE